MHLSNELISKFVKITNDNSKKDSKESTVYGVIVEEDKKMYVKLDGSEILTPVDTTSNIKEGERVTVMIKDHNAIVTGNITSPSAANSDLAGVAQQVGEVGVIVAQKVDTVELHAQIAYIDELIAKKASIEDLEADRADIKDLNADVANIETLLNGNLTSDNILSIHLTAQNTTVDNAFIKDAMIDSITANKIMSGIIDTNNVRIQSEDGSMLLQGTILQMKDDNDVVRIQIGKDNNGKFTFVLYDETGAGVLIDEQGIKSSDALSDGLIVDAKVANDANISGGKLDIASVITEVNNDNSTTIKSNKIYLDGQQQSLEVAFNSLKTQVETIQDVTVDGDLSAIVDQVQSNTTKIEVNAGEIDTLVSENVIRTEEIRNLEDEIQEVNTTLSSKYSSLEQDIDGFKMTVNDTYSTKEETESIRTSMDARVSETEMNIDSITQRVSDTELDLSETSGKMDTLTSRVQTAESKLTKDSLTTTIGDYYTTREDVDGVLDTKGYATKTELTQTADSFNFKVESSGAENLIKNSDFSGGLSQWSQNGYFQWYIPVNGSEIPNTHGPMIAISNSGGGTGIYQRFNTIVGQTYCVSFYTEGASQQPTDTVIGVQDIQTVTLNAEPGFKRWHFTFTATSTRHTFVAYLGTGGKFYLGRVMITQGSQLQEYRRYSSETYGTNVKIDIDGIEVTSPGNNTKTQVTTNGFVVRDTKDNSEILKANDEGVIARGGRFIVTDESNGHTVLWGRDIVINNQRALVGTDSRLYEGMEPHTLYINHGYDFDNGVEIMGPIKLTGELTHNGNKVLSQSDMNKERTGHLAMDNGIIFQWGTVNGTISNGYEGYIGLTFPVTFPNRCLYVGASLDAVDDNNGNIETLYIAHATKSTATGCTIAVKNHTSTKYGTTTKVRFFAIGY